MADTTISGSYTASVTLSNPATQNPATVTGHINATSGSALYGANATAWSIYNFGTLIGRSRGVTLANGGTISNAAAGLISGNRGIEITGSAGVVSNYGSIGGTSLEGIRLDAGGSVTNLSGGRITAGGTYAGVYIRDGGTVSNAASATISGAVLIYNSIGAVANQGSINAGSTSADGVLLAAGGNVTNAAGAVIGGSTVGVYVTSGTVSNAGVIGGGSIGVHLATGFLSNIGSINGAIQVTGTGSTSISNFSSGYLDGIQGGASSLVTVSNSGRIGGTVSFQDVGTVGNGAGALIADLYFNEGGLISNAGTISGTIYASHGAAITNAAGGRINVAFASGPVANAGTIYGNLSAGGPVTNATSGWIYGASAAGPLTNSGTIISLAAGAPVTNAAGGLITRVRLYGSDLLTNSGVISGFGALTVNGYASLISLTSGGTVSNTGAGVISTNERAVVATGTAASVVNSGELFSSAAHAFFFNGIYVDNPPPPTIGPSPLIYLGAGGVVVNTGTLIAQMDSLSAGVYQTPILIKGSGSVFNSGTIESLGAAGSSSDYYGITLSSGSVTNAAGGVMPDVSSSYSINLYNAGTLGRTVLGSGSMLTNAVSGTVLSTASVSTIINLGHMEGSADASSVTNASGAIIAGVTANNVTNAGLMAGVAMDPFGTLRNSAGGTIAGGSGVGVFGSGSIVNYGVISGATGVGFSGTLVNDGLIAGGTGANFAGTLANSGTIATTVTGGNAVIITSGLLIAEPGAAFVGGVEGLNGSIFELAAGAGSSANSPISIVSFGSITFDPGAEWTIAGNKNELSGLISGFAQADTIDLTGLSEIVENYSPGTLTLTGDLPVTLRLPGNFTTASFATAPDAGTGTDIFLACFVAGTRIATDHGDVPVEHLRIGEHAMTLGTNGTLVPRPIRWIGRRRIDLARHPRPETARPIRIRRDAFEDHVPDRDLLLSPDHAIYAEGVLIPVRHLANDRSVTRAKRLRHVEYFHIELDQHAILLANGMPVESYLDTGDRSSFENGGVAVTLHPDFASRIREAGGYATLMVTGPEVVAARCQLKRRADQLLSARPARSMRR